MESVNQENNNQENNNQVNDQVVNNVNNQRNHNRQRFHKHNNKTQGSVRHSPISENESVQTPQVSEHANNNGYKQKRQYQNRNHNHNYNNYHHNDNNNNNNDNSQHPHTYPHPRPQKQHHQQNNQQYQPTQTEIVHRSCSGKTEGEKIVSQLKSLFADVIEMQNAHDKFISETLKKKIPCKNGNNCTFGSACLYKHDKTESDTHSTTSSSSKKDTPCKYGEECKLGDRCLYKHEGKETIKPPSYYTKNVICKYGDKCKNKKNCQYKHVNTFTIINMSIYDKTVESISEELANSSYPSGTYHSYTVYDKGEKKVLLFSLVQSGENKLAFLCEDSDVPRESFIIIHS